MRSEQIPSCDNGDMDMFHVEAVVKPQTPETYPAPPGPMVSKCGVRLQTIALLNRWYLPAELTVAVVITPCGGALFNKKLFVCQESPDH